MDILFLFLMVIGFMLVGVPIAISLGLSSVLFLLMHSDASLASVAQTLFNAFAGHYTLLAIPFFILASSFMSTGGVAKRIIRFAIAIVGWFRGGLAMASVVACMMFAALSGSSPATVVAIGSIVIAGMIKNGYSKEFASGVICNAGTLGILIPPSIVMVVYAAATDVSVGRMFLGGVIPGLLAGVMLMIAITLPRESRTFQSNLLSVGKKLLMPPRMQAGACCWSSSFLVVSMAVSLRRQKPLRLLLCTHSLLLTLYTKTWGHLQTRKTLNLRSLKSSKPLFIKTRNTQIGRAHV